MRTSLVCLVVLLLTLLCVNRPTSTATVYLPVVTQNYSSALLSPADFHYMGAFRLPEGGERPLTFAYGGNAMTYRPDGDPAGPDDGFPGSLFITGHDRMPYGELPDGSRVAEVTIPTPIDTRQRGNLNQAVYLQSLQDVTQGHFTNMDEIVRMGMQYLDTPATGPQIHLAWGQHFEPEPPAATHAWFSPNLSTPNLQGFWFIGNQSFYSVNDYMLEIPIAWANQYTQGRQLGTGRFRDGGWSGMGPALFAYQPWVDDSGTPAANGTHLPEMTLLLYQSSTDTEAIQNCLSGYQHPDEWSGAAWLTTPGGKEAVLFAGSKSLGNKYWYGYLNPAGANLPCVAGEFVGQFPVCRLANGSLCPPEDLVECAGHTSMRGWWSTHMQTQFILYDPADLARVASGEIPSWQPQPYTSLSLDSHFYLNPDHVEEDMIGTGVQRRYRIGDVTFDRIHGLLYVLELFSDQAQPIVHVWQVRP